MAIVSYASPALGFAPRQVGGLSGPGKSSEMLAGDGQRDPFAGLAPQGGEHRRVSWSEDLYGEGGLQRLAVSLSRAFTDDREMLLHRGGVRVDLNDRYFAAVVVDVLVERDQ